MTLLLRRLHHRVRREIRRTVNRLHPRAVVLLYHRIAATDWDPLHLCVAPQHFAKHLEHLRERYRVLSLPALSEAVARRRVPHGAVAVTFDDGYVDNLVAARPLLERYGIPATVFATAGTLPDGAAFWWDTLASIVHEATVVPSSLHLEMTGDCCHWRFPPGPSGTPDRQRVFARIQESLRPLPNQARQNILKRIADSLGSNPRDAVDCRSLTFHELKTLDASGFVEIGAHTISHPVLSTLPAEEQYREIADSKRMLEEVLGRVVTCFAYPYGGWGETTTITRRLAKEAGFKTACADGDFIEPVTNWSQRHWLPRCPVRDWDGQTFARELTRYFLG